MTSQPFRANVLSNSANLSSARAGGSTDPEPSSAARRLRDLLLETVADVFNVDVGLLRLPTRGRANIALARQVAMYIAHVGCGLTLTEVGELFERDRTTVSHACAVVEFKREEPGFDEAIRLLEQVIRVLEGSGPSGPAQWLPSRRGGQVSSAS